MSIKNKIDSYESLFMHRCGFSSSFFLYHLNLLVLLLLPSWVLVLCLLFFLLVAPNPLLLTLSFLFFVHCVATPLLLLLFWMNDCIVLDIVDIGLMMLFEVMLQTKMTFFFERPHTDCWSVWNIFLLNDFFFQFFFF